MRSRSRSVTVGASYRASGNAARWLLAHDHVDHGRERDELAVTEPPLRFAHVAGREGEVALAHSHRDRDEVALLALGAGPRGGLRHRASSVGGRGSRDHSTEPSSLESAVRWLPHPPSARPPAAPPPPGAGGDKPWDPMAEGDGPTFGRQTAIGAVVRSSRTTQPTGGVIRSTCSSQRSSRFGSRSASRPTITTARSA